MGWITVAGGSSVVTKPIFTRRHNKDVLAFLQLQSPSFESLLAINIEAGVENIKETQIILNDLIRRGLVEEFKGRYGIPLPYDQFQYNRVLNFFQNYIGELFSLSEVNEEASIGSEKTTQAILDAQILDIKTGVIRDLKSGKYGILLGGELPPKGKL